MLRGGSTALGLDLDAAQLQKLLAYLDLLQKWNRVYNLTAVRDPMQMLHHHLLDSLAAVAPLRRELLSHGHTTGARVLDVGSGGGLPGVVFAICCREIQVTCVDAVAKKAAFIRQVAATLGLDNLQAIHARVEQLPGSFDVVCSRAFAALSDFVGWTSASLSPNGLWMAMKGQLPTEEIAALPSLVRVFHVEQLQVPGLDARRCIVWLEPVASTS